MIGDPITSWDTVPLLVSLELVMQITGFGSHDAVKSAILRRDLPEPVLHRPMRWSKADLMRHFHFEAGIRPPSNGQEWWRRGNRKPR